MNVRELERLKRHAEQKRDARIQAAEADYKREIESIEVVWSLMQGEEVSPAYQASATFTPLASKARATGVKSAVKRAISEFDKDFSTDDVFEKVLKVYPDVKRQTVTDALSRMASTGELETVVPGRGRRMAVYRIRKDPQNAVTDPERDEIVSPLDLLNEEKREIEDEEKEQHIA